MNRAEYLKLVKEIFVNKGEYKFINESKSDAKRFAKKLLSRIEDLYTEEHFYREYEDLSDFIRSYHADSEAYWLYTDGDY